MAINLIVSHMAQESYNITAFSIEQQRTENLLDTGKMSLFFNALNISQRAVTASHGAGYANTGAITVLFQTLDNIFSMQGKKKAICEGLLKDKIYDYSKNKEYSDIMAHTLDLPEYKYNPNFSQVISKVQYLGKNILFSNWRNGFLRGTKFSHHVGKILGGLPLSSKGSSYFTAGIALLVAGMSNFYPASPDQPPNKIVGTTCIVPGIGLFVSPFVSAAQSALTDNP